MERDKKILVFAPHGDDCEIGMGGTVANFINEGYEVKIVCAIIPAEDIKGEHHDKRKSQRWKETEKAAQILGADLEILDINPYEFSYNREHVKIFDDIVRKFDPCKIFSCWEHDSHQDHKILHNLVISATRKNRNSLYMYETMLPGGISTVSFNPQMFINISNTIDVKKRSIDCYESVFKGTDYSDSVISRARFRGRQIGVKYAEAFQIVKEIIL